MKVITVAVVAAAVAWAAAPWVAMARRGTIDSRTVAGWRTECVVPAPRRAPDDEPARERGTRGSRHGVEPRGPDSQSTILQE